MRLHRAIRLVVDTGLHAKGWTEQQAVEYFDANSAVPRAAIESEVMRYLTNPGQATGYKQNGTLHLALSDLRLEQLRRNHDHAGRMEIESHLLRPEEVLERWLQEVSRYSFSFALAEL